MRKVFFSLLNDLKDIICGHVINCIKCALMEETVCYVCFHFFFVTAKAIREAEAQQETLELQG